MAQLSLQLIGPNPDLHHVSSSAQLQIEWFATFGVAYSPPTFTPPSPEAPAGLGSECPSTTGSSALGSAEPALALSWLSNIQCQARGVRDDASVQDLLAADDMVAAAGLVRVSQFGPGIARVRARDQFTYLDPNGQRITDAETLQRIKHLAIPPAWRDVWISPDPRSHIQATGFDNAGRKQYRYHSAFRDLRDHAKFDEVATFGETLPIVRDRIEADLSTEGLGHARVLGCAVRLLDLGSFRIGTDRYAVHDDTHGLTTMLTRDVRLEGEQIVFDYVGKSHKHQVQHVVDRDAASIVRELLSLRAPEQRLFAFRNPSGWVDLHAGDVNHYLRDASGMSSSAKEFRTWNATVLGASALAGAEPPRSKRATDRALKSAATVVASYLGNTPAIARRSYVDPRVFDHYRAGWTIRPEVAQLGIGLESRTPSSRRPVEIAVLDLIRERWDSSNLRATPESGAPAQGR